MRHQIFMTCCAALATLSLSACDVTVPSQVKAEKIRLQEDVRTVSLDVQKPDDAAVAAAAADYARNGRGAARLVVPYRSGDPLQEVSARRQGKAYGDAFARHGLSGLKVDYVAVEDPRLLDHAVLSYAALQALPPPDCRTIPGMRGADTLEAMRDYEFGCETRTAISKMIVRPEDLMGREGGGPNQSERAGNMIQNYKTGKPNPRIGGVQASSIGR